MTEFVDIQGEPLAVQVFEPAEHRGDAVLIHGYTGSKEDFVLVGPLLAERGYRAVTFDNRGQNESAHSQREDAYSIASLARDAALLADHFGMERPHLLGHSFGGLVAQRAAVQSPHRWASLTLFCSGPGAIPGKPELPATIEVLKTMSMVDVWNTYRDEDAKSDPVYELMKRRWALSDARSVMTHARHLIDEPSIVAAVRATGLPTYVVYGERDDAWPLEMQDQMASDLDAPITVIADAGHCPNEDQPAVTAMVLADFWDSL